MPCYDNRVELNYSELIDLKRQNRTLKTALNEATRAACEALTLIDPPDHGREGLSKETMVWWKDHQRRDAKRKK